MKKTTRAYHHGDLKTAMIRAALALGRVKGPRGSTLNEASRAAGVSVSAPYNHFKDKEALLIKIGLLGSRTLEMELRAAADTTGPPRHELLAVQVEPVDLRSICAPLQELHDKLAVVIRHRRRRFDNGLICTARSGENMEVLQKRDPVDGNIEHSDWRNGQYVRCIEQTALSIQVVYMYGVRSSGRVQDGKAGREDRTDHRRK